MFSRTLFDTAKVNKRATQLVLGAVVLSLCLFSVLFFSGNPQLLKLLNVVYVGATVALGFWLYASNPALYLGFVFWIWFLSPLVRRLIDYQLGMYTPTSSALTLLAPFLVTAICAISIPRYGGRLLTRPYLPFFLCLIGVIYGFLVGLPKSGGFPAFKALLEWVPPLLLGFHVAATWTLYPSYKRTMRTTFVAGTFVLGVYGIVQFFFLPPWDAFWMTSSGMHSIGQPFPYEVRVFSTLNAPGPFATMLIPGLLLATESRSLKAKLSFLPGMISFLLAIVRSAWGGGMLGLGYLLYRLRGLRRVRLLLVFVVMSIAVVPFAMTGEIAEQTAGKFSTLQNLEEDQSLQERKYMYRTVTMEALMNPIGEGLGSSVFDSGFVTILWQLGWFGGILYLGSLSWLVWTLSFGRAGRSLGSFGQIVVAVVFAYFGMMIFGRQILEVVGCILWAFIGLAVAGHRYKTQQLNGAASETEDAEPDPVSSSSVPEFEQYAAQ